MSEITKYIDELIDSVPDKMKERGLVINVSEKYRGELGEYYKGHRVVFVDREKILDSIFINST